MSGYDDKTFKELLGMLTDQVTDVLLIGKAPPDPDGLQVALRKAVIREAQVATVILPELQAGESITLVDVQQPIAAGTYFLVPKEIT